MCLKVLYRQNVQTQLSKNSPPFGFPNVWVSSILGDQAVWFPWPHLSEHLCFCPSNIRESSRLLPTTCHPQHLQHASLGPKLWLQVFSSLFCPCSRSVLHLPPLLCLHPQKAAASPRSVSLKTPRGNPSIHEKHTRWQAFNQATMGWSRRLLPSAHGTQLEASRRDEIRP